ncbi:MAG: ComEC/Rec2 family competence protein [Kiritimatiellae bacterium]|nr:ComEC/Rec2 family competence protein [Kiritimatiellia bacterium]
MRAEYRWFVFCGLLASAEGVAFAIPFMADAWPFVALLCAIAGLFAFGRISRMWLCVFVALAGFSLAWQTQSSKESSIRALLRSGREGPIVAVFEIPEGVQVKLSESKTREYRAVFNSTLKGVDVSVNLFIPEGCDLPRAGERWECAGRLHVRPGKGVFSRHSFFVRGKESFARRIGLGNPFFLERWLGRARNCLSEKLAAGLDSQRREVALMRAMLLGERSKIDRGLRESFVASGTVHLFAISGLHVFIVTHIFAVFLQILCLPWRLRAAVLILAIWFYVFITGCAPSSLRAGLMASLYCLAGVFGRKGEALTSWAQAFAIIHVVKPESLMNIGSVLSFAVMLGLVLWRRVAGNFRNWFALNIVPGFVAWAFGAPFVAVFFAVVTPGGILANLLAVPMAVVAVTFSAAGAFTGLLSDSLASLFNTIAFMATSLMVAVAELVGSFPWSNFQVQAWSFADCCVWYAVLSVVFMAVYHISVREERL